MEMSNVTAGGPSYGIFDVLLGNKPQEGPADGKGFEPLLNLVKALNKEKTDEDDAQAVGRTNKETEAGKKAEEYRLAIAPAILAASSQGVDFAEVAALQDEAMRLSPTQLQQLMAAKVKSMQQAMPLQAVEQTDGLSEMLHQMMRVAEEPVDIGQVANGEALKLTPEMKRMLAEQPELQNRIETSIDSRIQELARELVKRQESSTPVEGLVEKAVLAKGGMELLQSDAAKKQLNLKAAEVQVSTDQSSVRELKPKKPGNEKMFTTEDFLQVKENGVPKQAAVAEQSESGVKSELAEKLQKATPEKSRGTKPDLKNGADVNQPLIPGDLALKASAGLAVRDVFISDAKPDEMRGRLVGEVAQSVGLQAQAGGGEMRLVIHPEHLGELKLKVGTNEGKVEVSVIADNNDVAKTLRASHGDLREALQGQHLTLSKFEVHVAQDSSMASNQDNGDNLQNRLFQENADSKSNSGTFADQNGRDNSSSRRDDGISMGDISIPKPRALRQGSFGVSNKGGSRLDVVA